MRIAALLRRDLGLAFGGGRGGPWLPVLFFVAVAVLFPFAVAALDLWACTFAGLGENAPEPLEAFTSYLPAFLTLTS